MITSKKLRLLLGALCVTGSMMSAQAQSAVHPKAYYDGITYEWTDASGVVHTDAITTEATNGRQIVALLKKIYCDPNLPGPTYTAINRYGERENEVYYGSQAGGWNISANDVTKPYEDGYTLLMVAVKNDPLSVTNDDEGQMFSSESELINYFDKNVTSVVLLTDGLRIGSGENAGTAFNISGSYNRFFMISKGQSRKKNYQNSSRYGEQPPFKQMFEEFSPTTGDPDSQITDFYVKMIAGDAYPVIHDCVSVIENKHFFSMAGNKGTEYKSLTGLNIFIPDYRLKYYTSSGYDGRTMNPTGGTWKATYAKYNPDHAPMVGIYNVKLDANVEPTAQEHVYEVTLNWTSSLDEMANEAVPQNYTIYVVKVDENGNEYNEKLDVTSNTTYSYTVDQDEHSYTITYVIYAQPSDGEHDMFEAWSNQDNVIIPGWNDFLNLSLNHVESDFVKGADPKNYYRNFLNVKNEDDNNALTTDRLTDENSFVLYRIDTDYPDVMIPVAELNLTKSYYGSSVNYTITYDNQEKLSSYNVNVKTSGTLSVGQGNVIDLSDILFVDQFAASVGKNTHPERYDYILVLNNDNMDKSSNTVEVHVQKINANIDGYYTLDQVLNDTDRGLTAGVKISNFNMMLSPNPSIYYYTIDRGNNVEPNERISKIQRRSNGSYEEQMNVLPQYFNDIYEPGEEITRIEDVVYTGQYTDFMAYQPIVWTTGTRVNDTKENSYGSPVWKIGVGKADVTVAGTRATTEYGEWKDKAGNLYAIYNPIITVKGIVPEYASAEYEPFMYRVWRVCDDLRGYWINSSDMPVDYPWSTPAADELIINEQTTADEVHAGSDELDSPNFNELAFGAKVGADINFIVRFYYKKVGDLVRDNNAPLYYVVETEYKWQNMPTAVNEINTGLEVSKTYVNAQGVKSNKPFDGVNIVITRYSDGSTKTTKVIR